MTTLHQFGDAIRQLLTMVPLGAVRALFVLLPVMVLIWLLRLPSDDTCSAPDGVNLKPWAVAALLLQILIYLLI